MFLIYFHSHPLRHRTVGTRPGNQAGSIRQCQADMQSTHTENIAEENYQLYGASLLDIVHLVAI